MKFHTERNIMDKKVTSIVAYITWVGLLIAFVAGDREGAKFHLNQALVIWIVGIINVLIRFIPLIGGILSTLISILILICTILGIIYAAQGQEKEVPILGAIKLLN